MKWGLKHIFLGIIMVTLFLPLIQSTFHYSKIEKLSGDFIPAPNTPITKDLWLSKEFQEKKEKYINDHFGYRETCIRIYNQFAFYLFKKAKANGVTIGKENYLFEQGYIDAYYGQDYIGADSIRNKCIMLSMLNDTLKKLNKTLLLVFAPGKAAFYPEYIPPQPYSAKGITNIEVYLRFVKELNIAHIDFHTWFNHNKKKSPYPLVPKYGTHWSQFGAYIAMDSILKRIEHIRNIDIPGPTLKKMNVGKFDGSDYDIEKGMNLFFRFKKQDLANPEISYPENPDQTKKPATIVIADSYYWQMLYMGIANCFSSSNYWYYFKQAHNPKFEHSKKIEEINVSEDINNHDVMIIMASDINLPKFGWGFIDSAYYKYYKTAPNYSLYYNKNNLHQVMNDIASDPNWMQIIQQKAEYKNISVDSMLYLDALYVIEQNK